MNAQSNDRTEVKQGKALPTARPQRAAWIQKNNRRLQLLRVAIVGISALTVLIGLILLLLPAFRVKEIVVKGNTVTLSEEIAAASGVKAGDELVGLDMHKVIENVQASCPVKVISVRATLNKLIIEVSEREAMYTAYAGKWFSLDREMNVLDVSDSEEEYAALLKVELPPIQRITLGAPVTFCNPDADLSYITELIDGLDSMGLTEQVDLIDVSEKFNVSYVRNGSLRIVLGKVSELAEKQALAEQILLAKAGSEGCAVIDVSNVKCSTYRPVTAIELMA